MRRHGMTTVTDLLVLIQCLDESDVYTPIARANSKGTDRGWSRNLASTVSRLMLSELAAGAGAGGYEKRCKRSLVLLDWTCGTPMKDIERRFSANPFNAVSLGTVRSFADNARFHLRSASDIARKLFESLEFPDGLDPIRWTGC
jgi:hypothetical protein